jgi:hypothetical protein
MISLRALLLYSASIYSAAAQMPDPSVVQEIDTLVKSFTEVVSPAWSFHSDFVAASGAAPLPIPLPGLIHRLEASRIDVG